MKALHSSLVSRDISYFGHSVLSISGTGQLQFQLSFVAGARAKSSHISSSVNLCYMTVYFAHNEEINLAKSREQHTEKNSHNSSEPPFKFKFKHQTPTLQRVPHLIQFFVSARLPRRKGRMRQWHASPK
jgi:hypothetical protein